MSPHDPNRVDPKIKNLRRHAASGTLINSGFQIGLAGLGMLQRVAVAAFLTREEFGIWGIVLTILITLAWLKQIGIVDKYIQQNEPDQELAFQKAFTIELCVSLIYWVVVVAVIPIYALAYGDSDIVVPALILALNVPLTALEAPAWIAYRRMQYFRQRVLTAISPVVSFVVTVTLAAAGLGYWSLLVGVLAGSAAAATVCVATSPYPIRLRFDRVAVREYASFSWPLLGGGLSRLFVVQGALIAVTRTDGVAAVGSIGLALSVAMFADRVDQIVSQTIYPAVCAVVDRVETLYETFVKTNRIALMWAMPCAAAVALFAHDLTRYVLGERWVSTSWLIAVMALVSGFGQVAFNWTVFMRALGRTRPIFTGAMVDLGIFVVVTLPAIVVLGLEGFAIGYAVAMLDQLGVRKYFLGKFFSGFSVLPQMLRAIAPTVPAAALILASRVVLPEGRSPLRALAELATFAAVAVAATYLWERSLIREMVGYLRRGRAERSAVALN